jgi:ligand-binding sensor domain-containing protein
MQLKKQDLLFKLFITLWVSLYSVSLCAQIYPYRHFSVREGLMNSNVYGMSQDESGFIWLATENGISRFDGLAFQNFSLENLALKSYVTSISCLPGNVIILTTGAGEIYEFNSRSEILRLITKTPFFNCNQVIAEGNVLVSLYENRRIHVTSIISGSTLYNDNVLESNCTNKALTIKKLADGKILVGRTEGIYILQKGIQNKLPISILKKQPVYSIAEYKQGLIAGGDGIIFQINSNTITDTLVRLNAGNKIKNLMVDSRNNIWFNIWGKSDLFMLSGEKITNVSEAAGISRGFISGILREKTGTIFVSTIGNGIYNFINESFLIYPSLEKLNGAGIRTINKLGNKSLLLGTEKGIASLDNETDNFQGLSFKETFNPFIKSIRYYGKDTFLVCVIDTNFDNKFSSFSKIPEINAVVSYIHASCIWSNSDFIITGDWDNKLQLFNKNDLSFINKKTSIFPNTTNSHRINCLMTDINNNLWIGSQKGLCVIDREGSKVFPDFSFKDEEVYKISEVDDDKVMVVSNDGIYLLKNNEDPRQVSLSDKIKIQGNKRSIKTGKNTYLSGTSNGLTLIHDSIRKEYSIYDGLLSENINDIYYDSLSKIIWVATSDGLIEFDPERLNSTSVKAPHISYIVLTQGKKRWYPGDTIQIDHSDASLTVKFQAFHYQNPHLVNYQYRIDNAPWQQVPGTELQIPYIKPGEHLIEIRSRLGETTSGNASSLKVIVAAPFYQTWWFYLSAIVAIMVFILYASRWQVNRLKIKQAEKSELQRKMVELQQKALASNLNPHFIFNSLNAIQHFINSRSAAEANDYLARFARLMRMHLNTAEKNSISLHEEIQRLEFYLGLEQMRFGDRMNWSLEVDKNLDIMQIEIPNMIIQPFLENAIWHGIMPSTRRGEIKLEFKSYENGLKIIVTDNGVGFNYHSHQAKNHESKGIKLIRQRLELLDPHAPDVIKFEHLEYGTRVTILITETMIQLHRDPVSIS